MTNISNSNRADLQIDDSSTEARLWLREVLPSDEGEYKCEITFLDITKDCPVVQLVRLTTLGEKSKLLNSFIAGKDTAIYFEKSVGVFCTWERNLDGLVLLKI